MAKREHGEYAGPRPIVTLLILLACILVLGAIFAAIKVFIIDTQAPAHQCAVQGPLPDPVCTPGAIFQNATAAQICVSGYSKSVRNVPQALKEKVYLKYNITHRETGEYEMDHLISLELGGSNDEANLFPEAAEPRPGFHEKDRVENWLHDEVCEGRLNLSEAQRIIATNWTMVLANATR